MVNLKVGTKPPWLGLGAAIWVQIASGNAYNFPFYSHSLKFVLGFNQHQLTMLGVANDIGENVGLLPSIACNKFPPWIVLLIGAFVCFLGYGVLWLAVSRTVMYMPYWLMTICPMRINKPGMPNQPVASSDEMLQGEGNADKTNPLLKPSESATYMGSFSESDGASEVDMLLVVGEGAVKKKKRPKRGEDFKFSEAVIKADFWLLFLVYFAGVGSGVTILNNLTQIGIA